MSNLNLPPERPLPDDVRIRMWERVEAEMTPRRRTARWVPAVAAAAAVIVVAGGVGVLLTTGPDERTPASASTAAEPALEDGAGDIPRCRDALASGQADVPAADRWVPVLRTEDARARVVGYIVGGSPVLCEITPSSTTVSRPAAPTDPANDSGTAVLLVTADGTVAGSTRSGSPLVLAVSGPRRDSYSGPAYLSGGLFAFRSPIPVGSVGLGSDGATALPLPPAPVVKAASGDPAAGEPPAAVRSCAEAARSFTTQSLPPGTMMGAIVRSGTDALALTVSGDEVSGCLSQAERSQVLTGIGTLATDPRPRLVPVAPTLDGKPLLAGTLPPDAQTVDLVLPDGTRVSAEVRNRTFAVLLPEGTPAPGGITALVRSSTGHLLYNGSL